MIELHLKLMLALYLFLVIIVLFLKPNYFFDKEKETIKHFGVGNDKNLCPLWLVFIMFAIISFLVVTILY